jgi:hypothetical protein
MTVMGMPAVSGQLKTSNLRNTFIIIPESEVSVKYGLKDFDIGH